MTAWVRSGVLAGAVELIRELGGDPDFVSREAQVSPKSLSNPDTPVAGSAVVHYLEAAAAHCRCQAFGLRLAERQQLSLFGPLSPLFESATTIGELFTDIAAYFPLHTQGALVTLEPDEHGIAIVYELAAGVADMRRQVVELGIGVLVSQIRRHRPEWRSDAIYFRHGPPPDLAEHRKRLGNRIIFNADRTALMLDRETMAMPTVSGDRLRHGDIAAGLEGARKALVGATQHRVEIIVRALLPFSPCDLTATAQMMRQSRRTLQRRLAKDHTSFEQIVDRVRADLALSYLHDSNLTVAQMAEILQFSQTSVLSRAVKRWYGASPRAIKRVKFAAIEDAPGTYVKTP